MKHILYILSSDAENLSLVLSYRQLLEKGYRIDCYAPHVDIVSLYPFTKNNISFKYIAKLHAEMLDKYSVIICGRNCFDAKDSELLINYKGIIIADDTCFYEGHSVFGDIICTCGESNYYNIPQYVRNKSYVIGCIKADYRNKDTSTVWNRFCGQYKEKVLFIESGHFPFGVEGRTVLAHEFCRMVKNHPAKCFVVKPRFLVDEVKFAKHRNTDHIYGYIMKEFDYELPENLYLLDSHEDMNLLINGADICMCTYCSAHIEVAYAGKRLINIYDVPSEEVADFRENRFRMIRDIMDQAGCNYSIYSLTEDLDSAHKASDEYINKVHGAKGSAIAAFVSIVEKYINAVETDGDKKDVIANRFIGYARKKMEYYENRLDEYTLCNQIQEAVLRIFYDQDINLEQKLFRVDEYIDRFILNYIDQNKAKYVLNSIQRAFCLRYLADRVSKEQAIKIGDYYMNFSPIMDAAVIYYMGQKAFSKKEYMTAASLFSQFLGMVEYSPYDTLDVERQDVILHVRQLLCEVEKYVR